MPSYRLALLTVVAAPALGVGGGLLVRVGSGAAARGGSRHGGLHREGSGGAVAGSSVGLGALANSRLHGALAGAAALVLGTVCWYFVSLAIHGPPAVGYVLPVSMGWSFVAGAAGAAFGLVGALWRDGDTVARAASIALLAGALVGEAVLLFGKWTGQAASLVLGLELLAATSALMLSRRRAPIVLTLSLFLVAAVAMAGAEDAARDTVRLVGWRGP